MRIYPFVDNFCQHWPLEKVLIHTCKNSAAKETKMKEKAVVNAAKDLRPVRGVPFTGLPLTRYYSAKAVFFCFANTMRLCCFRSESRQGTLANAWTRNPQARKRMEN